MKNILGFLEKVNIPPTISQMQTFANQFEPEAYKICCDDKEFLGFVSENLAKASARAILILSEIKPTEDKK